MELQDSYVPCARQDLSSLIRELGIIKFGRFTLKSGVISPYYIDFRESLGHPNLFRSLGVHMARLAMNFEYDLICGVPYAAVPISTLMALLLKKPLLMCRKEVKAHGQRNILEGKSSPGQMCLLVEDTVSTGSSIIDTVRILRAEGLQVENCLCLVCRDDKAKVTLAAEGVRLHSLFSLEELMHV